MIALLLLAASVSAQTVTSPVVRTGREIEWKASGSLPPGAEYHLVYEDPKSRAVQTLVRMPSGYELPPHSHTADETILVRKGKLVLTIDGKARELTVGGYAVLPGGTVFALKAKGFGGVEFLAAFAGPFDMKPAK